jgi:nucleoid DNA-binding protein
MILLDLAKEMKDNFGYSDIPTPDIMNAVRDAFMAIRKLAMENKEGFSFIVPKFGAFKIIKRPPRLGRNPKTGEKMNIPEKLVMRFKPSYQVRVGLNGQSEKEDKVSKKKGKEKKAKEETKKVEKKTKKTKK